MPNPSWTRPFPPGKHLHFSPLRRVQHATDSDGVNYNILVQTEEMSCGVAASVMLIDSCRGTSQPDSPAEELRLKHIAGKFPGSLVQSDKLWAVGKDYGSMSTNIEQLLKSQGVSVTAIDARWLNKGATLGIQSGRLRTPAMLLWGWYRQGLTGPRAGGHFTVAARRTTQGKIVILDPWDGSLTELFPGMSYHQVGIVDCVMYTS
jgi:hypothetical protein